MKSVALAQQAGATTARCAGRELVGSTLMGAWMAALVWRGLSLRPNLMMLTLWVVAARVALRLGHGVGAGTLACIEIRSNVFQAQMNRHWAF